MSKYLKVLKQIDKRMTAKGYKLVSVSDGEEALASAGNGKNAMYETISDMGYNNDKAEKDCEEVADQVAEHFERLHKEYA
jgi:uncharacterized protein (DUF302 family)